MEKNKGGWKSCGDTMSPQDESPRLKDLGIHKMQSVRWQQIRVRGCLVVFSVRTEFITKSLLTVF